MDEETISIPLPKLRKHALGLSLVVDATLGEMQAEVERLKAENAELRKQLEWQTMETCPVGKDVLIKFGELVFVGFVQTILGHKQIEHPRSLDYMPPEKFDGWRHVGFE